MLFLAHSFDVFLILENLIKNNGGKRYQVMFVGHVCEIHENIISWHANCNNRMGSDKRNEV